jgi:hypothetical protein
MLICGLKHYFIVLVLKLIVNDYIRWALGISINDLIVEASVISDGVLPLQY